MKKKIFSLFLGLCLIFSGLFSFSGCSLVKEDKNKINSNVVMKIGDTQLTKNDVINAFTHIIKTTVHTFHTMTMK
ncbi:MAG: hypothetical protein IJ310_01990 [Clostridia bacterium]|nr:hypothetical protein [Clostridia bacterium]